GPAVVVLQLHQQPQHELPDQPPGLTPAETSRDPGHHRVQETRPALIIGMRYRAPDGRRVLYFCHTKQRSRRPSRMSGTPPDRDHPRPPRRPAATSPQPRSTAAVADHVAFSTPPAGSLRRPISDPR